MVDFHAFKDLDVQILGVSVDEVFSQQTFADSLKLPFPLLSDKDAAVTRLYAADMFIKAGTDLSAVMLPGTGVTLKQDRTMSSQAFFLIDKQGILRGRWLPGREVLPNEKILGLARKIAGKR